jgi:hypothetical protein
MRTSNTKYRRNKLRSFGGDPCKQTDVGTFTVSLLFIEFIHSAVGTHKRMTKIKLNPFLCDQVNTNSGRYQSRNYDSNTEKCRMLLRLI